MHPTKKLAFLQIFRALAAGMVVIAHMAKEISHHAAFAGSSALHQLRSGTVGVDLFFVISGFIMVYTTREASGGRADASGFLERRLLRIVPVYWFYTTLFLAVLLLHPESLNHSITSLAHILGSYFFIPLPRPEDGMMEPILGLGWTLNYEMYFYAVFAILLLFPRRRLLPLIAVYFFVTVIFGIILGRETAMLWYWTRPNVLEFVFGAFIAAAFLNGVTIKPWLAVVGCIVAIVLWQVAFFQYSYGVENPDLRAFVWGIPAALLIGSVALSPALRDSLSGHRISAGLVAVGDSSYSLYLSHMFVVRIVTFILPVGALGFYYPAVFIVVGLCLSILVAHVSYTALEKPVAERGKAFLVSVRNG